MTQREKVKEILRSKRSFLYFVTSFCWIEGKAEGTAVRFNLWPSQIDILPFVTDAPRLVILKARQLGLTWLCAAYSLWLAMFRPLQLVVIISVNEDLAVEFLARIIFMLDRLPEWMRPEIKSRNRQMLEIVHKDGLNSIIQSMPTTAMGAQSKTPTLLILDETARNRMVGEIYAASKPGIDAGGGRIIVISNAIKTAPGWSWTRDLFVGAMRGENDFKRIFLPWQAHPDRPQDFKARQLSQGIDEEDFSQHYPETEDEAIQPTGGSYFGKALLRHTKTIKGIACTLTLTQGEYEPINDSKGILEVWRWPYRLQKGWDGHPWQFRYAIGSDVSEGLGQSYSVAYVIDRHKDEVVARMRSNRVDAYEWANLLDNLSKFYDRALVAVEVTGAGQTTVKRLIDLKTPQYVRLIRDTVGSGLTRQYGWPESQSNKHELCGDLKQWLNAMRGTLYCSVLIDECSTFIRDDKGRLVPEEGKYSDCVFAAGLAVQADKFIDGAAKKIVPEVRGWRERMAEEKSGSVWGRA